MSEIEYVFCVCSFNSKQIYIGSFYEIFILLLVILYHNGYNLEDYVTP